MDDDAFRTVRIGPKKRERHDIARGKQRPIRMTTFVAQIDRKLIVRFLTIFGEIMTKYAHPPLCQLASIGGKFGRDLRDCLVLIHSLAVYSYQAATLVVCAVKPLEGIFYFFDFSELSSVVSPPFGVAFST